MNKVNLDVIKPWITRAVIDLLGFEDDVVIDYAFSQLEDSPNVHPLPAPTKLFKQMLTGF
jgi:serine/arginine repetitive matrix protein 1